MNKREIDMINSSVYNKKYTIEYFNGVNWEVIDNVTKDYLILNNTIRELYCSDGSYVNFPVTMPIKYSPERGALVEIKKQIEVANEKRHEEKEKND